MTPEQKDRLAIIGQLSATIAHELRSPLSVLTSSVFLLRKRLEDLGIQDGVLEDQCQKIAAEVRDCSAMLGNLLDLARDRPVRKSDVRVTELVSAAVAAALVPDGVTVQVGVPDDLFLPGDADQLRQVLSNLIRNSVEALRGRGTIFVSASASEGATRIDVADDGPGVAPELESKIFEVLFTTKAVGTGLGLALARRVCEAHGGTLTLERPASGALLRVSLPAGGERTS